MFDIGIDATLWNRPVCSFPPPPPARITGKIRVRMGVAIGVAAGVHDHRVVQDRIAVRILAIAASFSKNWPKYDHVKLVDLSDHLQIFRLDRR